MAKNYDFAGWATRNDVLCSDGRVIMQNAFADQNGKCVPLVWNHQHDSVDNVLGHAMLENRDEGVYAYCSFNDSPSAQVAKQLVKHGDITSLSIYANQLKHNGTNVVHGVIREVSMVLAGANPKAFIDSVLTHSADGSEVFADDGTIYSGMPLDLMHSADTKDEDETSDAEDADEEAEASEEQDESDDSESTDEPKKNQNGSKAKDTSDEDSREDSDDEGEELDDSEETEDPKKKRKMTKSNVVEDKSTDVVDKLGKKDSEESDAEDEKEDAMANTMSHSDDDLTVADVINGMTDKQKAVAFYVIAQALKQYGVELEDEGGADAAPSNLKHSADEEDDGGETVGDVLNSFSKQQMDVIKYIIGQTLADNGITEDDIKNASNKNDEEDDMSHNVFDRDADPTTTLMHSADCDFSTMMADARQYGTLSQSMLAHGADIDNLSMGDYLAHADYGMENIDVMFPDAKAVSNQPFMVTRDLAWVPSVMGAVNHTPFSRIKSLAADLTEDEARAKGYIKGNQKKNEVFPLFKRVTTPTTVYKKQKLDRDDIMDITDFDVIVWLKAEMRTMLDEEIARAILIGDGRETSSEDKINEQNVRPIWTDDSVYSIKQTKTFTAEPSEDELADSIIESAVRARKNYRGSGNPVLFTTEDNLTSMLLMKDKIGHRLYPTTTELAAAMRVSAIYTVPEMEGQKRTPAISETELTGKTPVLDGIVVNLKDYTVGTDKGGAVSMFDDFDIDYNQQKYLIETRISGALTVPYSAIVLEHVVSA